MVNSAILSHVSKDTTVIPLFIWGRKIPFGVEIGVEKRSGLHFLIPLLFSCRLCPLLRARWLPTYIL